MFFLPVLLVVLFGLFDLGRIHPEEDTFTVLVLTSWTFHKRFLGLFMRNIGYLWISAIDPMRVPAKL